MEYFSIEMLGFLLVAGFLASFIDSVVGGGGIISVPALLMTGMPPVWVLGTNKMASVMGSLTSTLSFIRSGKIDYKLIRYLFPLALIGSALGVWAVQLIPAAFLKPMVVVMLSVVTVYTLTKKEFGQISTYQGMNRRRGLLSGVVVFAIGFYDGFFGPGAGSFLMFGFLMLGFDFVVAAGNARALNFASNMAAAILFAILGKVNYLYALPMGLAMIAGAVAGTRLAITQGASYVRPLFILMSTLLIGKQLWDLMH